MKKRLGELLLEGNRITEEQLEDALPAQRKLNLKLGQFLIREGIVKDNVITDVLSQQLGIMRYHPEKYPLSKDLSGVIPFNIVQKHKVAPIKKNGRILTVAMTDPLNINSLDSIEALTNCEIDPILCGEQELNELITAVYGSNTGVVEILKDIAADDKVLSDSKQEETEDVQVASLEDMAGEPAVVRLVNSIFEQAIRSGASDVHISPKQNELQLRFRIDGKLHDVQSPPKTMLPSLVARVKIMANVDITVMRLPQDGRFTLKMDEKEVNVRVSTIPTVFGENLVLRFLDRDQGIFNLERLGMRGEDTDKLKTIIRKPHGMILSTGPTGSGKSTSLYALLNEINKPDINIITLEDPVEYRVETIRQVQLNQKAGMTFASGLRAILRQDPDVVLVGEIRDAETAAIAIHAAHTGQRVLSTVHTNDAVGVITRFIDIGIDPYLVSSVLLLTFSQRLIRTICSYCSEPYSPPQEVLAAWGLDKADSSNFQRGKGCQHCMNTGYKGRTGIFEVLINDEMIHEMILQKKSSTEITREAVSSGKLRTLKVDAAFKVLNGITTFEEVASAVMM